MDVAIALAEHYHIRELLEPITSFVPSDKSPPPAPKHAIASSGRLKKTPSDLTDPSRARASSDEISSEVLVGEDINRSEGSISPSPSDMSSSSRTPRPIAPDAPKADQYTRYADPRMHGMYAGGRHGAGPPLPAPSRTTTPRAWTLTAVARTPKKRLNHACHWRGCVGTRS